MPPEADKIIAKMIETHRRAQERHAIEMDALRSACYRFTEYGHTAVLEKEAQHYAQTHSFEYTGKALRKV